MNSLTIGLIQTRYRDSIRATRELAIDYIYEAAERGAQVVCLQELFHLPYFCTRQDTRLFDLAEPIPGQTTEMLCEVAEELNIVLIAPVFERRMAGVFYNSAAIIDADGTLLGTYRKKHIPQDPGFEEKFYFTPGDGDYPVWETAAGKLGVLICWDQWYPEAARLTALAGAEILFYPTAIGWLPEEKDELGASQHTAWETVQRGHAVANGAYVAAINRSGREGDTEFWGQSFVANPYSEIIKKANPTDDEVLIAQCDLSLLEEFRRIWPFFRDRRIDTYSSLTKRTID